jgi:L-alanine-DL-glutamate epimerase-like enolase superfamily enzyme
LLLGQQAAKSPIDIACWDILGKAAGMPVAQLLGGVLQQDFPLYEAIPLGAPEEMARFAASRQADGVNAFQVKVGNEPRQDVARTRTVLDAVEPETALVADANGGWDLARAQIAMREMQGMPVFVEQPCRALQDCAIVQRASSLPLSLDESVTAAGDLHRAKYEAGACAVNIKLSRVGGLSRAAAMRDHACELAMRVSLEDTWGGDLTTAAVSHLAASTPPEHLLLVSFMNDWTNEHLAGYLPRSGGGRGSAPSGAGLGVEVDLSQLDEPLFSVNAQ